MKDADEWVGPTLANTSSFLSAVTSSTFFVALILVRGQSKLCEVFEATDSEAPKEKQWTSWHWHHTEKSGRGGLHV